MIGNLPAQLHDIRELDPIGWWPPAPGWWLLAVGCAITLYLLFYLTASLVRDPPGSWRREARRHLRDLRRRQTTQPPKQTAAELSELLRRISIARFGRAACAARSGDNWLKWLQAQDPNNFNWPRYGQLLIQLPYAPVQQGGQTPALDQLITAAINLVNASHEDASRKRRRFAALRD